LYIKIYFFIIIPEYNKIEKQSGRVCVFQSLVLSFILGGIIVLTFALVDEKIYQEHRFPYIFLLSTFVLLFESLLVFLDMTLFSNIQLSDLNMLLWPVYLYPYYHYANRTNRLCSIFYSFFTYLAVEGTATFLTIIVSSVIGDAFVAAHSIVYNMFIRLVSLGIILKLIDLFEFDFTPFYEEEFEKYLKILISVYFAIFVVINFALWISEQAQFKNFGSMLATICFFTFVVSLFHMKIERDQYRKNLELEYKEFSEQQMSRYMAEIQSLYSIVRGFRHDLGNLVISMSLAIEEENIPEIRRIHREVLEKSYKKINAEELSGFNLVNIRDSALRSILIRGWLDARDAGVEMTFETSEPIEQLPVDLLDIVRIVGILVTNALEASKEAEEKKVHIAIFSISKIVYLVIHNTTNEITFDIRKIYEEGYSTKGENRGLGLNNVRKILAISQQIRVEKHIAEIAKELEIKLEVISTGKIKEFENYIQHSEIHQLYFLDIHIQDNEYCGLEIAQKIREANPYAIIVFITTKSEFASITYRYKVSALDFIDKNLNEDLFRLKIKECIEYLTTIQIGNDDLTDYFEYDFKDKKIKIPFKDILYIETVGSAYKLNLVGKNFQKEIAGSLSDVLEKDVEERYFSPHQSFIVNRSMIIGMDKKKKQLLLKEGYSCPISRSNIKRVKKLIEEQNLEFSA